MDIEEMLGFQPDLIFFRCACPWHSSDSLRSRNNSRTTTPEFCTKSKKFCLDAGPRWKLFGPSDSAEICRGFLLYKFCRGFSWRILFPTAVMRRKNPATRSRKKTAAQTLNLVGAKTVPALSSGCRKRRPAKGVRLIFFSFSGLFRSLFGHFF